MQFDVQANRIEYRVDGQVLACVTFPETAPGLVDINHTFVDPSLRGQGVAGRLMEQAAAALRQTGRKASLSCSYAQKWFARNPQWEDVLAP